MEFILGFITAIVLVAVAIAIWSKNNVRRTKSNTILFKHVKARDEANIQLKERLISMLGGDEEKAERLVARKRFGKEGKYSENYYWWLAIRELEKGDDNQ